MDKLSKRVFLLCWDPVKGLTSRLNNRTTVSFGTLARNAGWLWRLKDPLFLISSSPQLLISPELPAELPCPEGQSSVALGLEGGHEIIFVKANRIFGDFPPPVSRIPHLTVTNKVQKLEGALRDIGETGDTGGKGDTELTGLTGLTELTGWPD